MPDQNESTADPSTEEGSGGTRSSTPQTVQTRHWWHHDTLRTQMDEERRDCGIGSGGPYRHDRHRDPESHKKD